MTFDLSDRLVAAAVEAATEELRAENERLREVIGVAIDRLWLLHDRVHYLTPDGVRRQLCAEIIRITQLGDPS